MSSIKEPLGIVVGFGSRVYIEELNLSFDFILLPCFYTVFFAKHYLSAFIRDRVIDFQLHRNYVN